MLFPPVMNVCNQVIYAKHPIIAINKLCTFQRICITFSVRVQKFSKACLLCSHINYIPINALYFNSFLFIFGQFPARSWVPIIMHKEPFDGDAVEYKLLSSDSYMLHQTNWPFFPSQKYCVEFRLSTSYLI